MQQVRHIYVCPCPYVIKWKTFFDGTAPCVPFDFLFNIFFSHLCDCIVWSWLCGKILNALCAYTTTMSWQMTNDHRCTACNTLLHQVKIKKINLCMFYFIFSSYSHVCSGWLMIVIGMQPHFWIIREEKKETRFLCHITCDLMTSAPAFEYNH